MCLCLNSSLLMTMPLFTCFYWSVCVCVCVCVCVHSGVQHTLCCVFLCFISYCVPEVVSFSKQRLSRISENKFTPSPLKLVVTVLKWNNIRLVCQTTQARLLCLAENVGVQYNLGKKSVFYCCYNVHWYCVSHEYCKGYIYTCMSM
jgi:hypothetical protein